MLKINKVLKRISREKIKSALLVLTGSIYGFMLFFSGICSAASYPQSTTTPLAIDLSMNQYNLNDVGDIITKGPWVDVRAYTSFSAAIDAIGASNKTLLIPNTQTVSANKTVPTNVHLLFLKGGSFSIDAGVTVTINGPLDAPMAQIFSGNGSVSFGTGSVKEVYPQWWGANGAGVTDDAIPINKAINAFASGRTGRVTLIPPSVAYLIADADADGICININGRPIELYGVGPAYDNTTGVRILKNNGTNGVGISVNGSAAASSIIRNIYLDGQTNNGGDGIQIRSNGVAIYDTRVGNQGRDGIRIGGDVAGDNANSWIVQNTHVNNNGRHGFYVHDNTGTSDVNNGTGIQIASGNNANDQFLIDKTGAGNVFIQPLVESYTVNPFHITVNALAVTLIGGAVDLLLDFEAPDVTLIGCNVGAFTDNGAVRLIRLGGIYPATASLTTQLGVGWHSNRSQPTYGTTVSIDTTNSNMQEITVTNGANFTIANPTPVTSQIGQYLTIRIRNASGGNMGTVTWGNKFKMSLWTKPANGKNRSVTFFYDGSYWIEISRTSADVPN